MQDASGMCTSISRLFRYEFSAETSLWCQTWAFLISSTQNKLPNRLAVSCCGRTGAEIRPPASPPAMDPGSDLMSRDNRRRHAVLAPLHPPLGCRISRHMFSAVPAPGWLFWCPQNCCLSWTIFGDWLRDTIHQDKESRFLLPQVG